ncbi:dicarboxylate/amino acid:cation symporter [Sphingomonas canadensis]|uniref:Dicarboxylate/amino acid:cation symporter n=1 Tax=Sphingomonas canadensis TaxID=1219257 RepID=A0ABW3H562_9SPHN|nr:dicarboxylate/amino acid:cation symporter [Sphingomonas canadensis]MCW3836228.1 dicarboxylate/amino acid:cation symporter [Sphingomonas canadensis]
MSGALRGWFAIPLWQRILGALVLGVALGLLLGEQARAIAWIGDLWIRLIRMMVLPLVLAMIVGGVAAMGDPARLGRVGARTVLLLVGMTTLAICVGLALGTLLRPGAGMAIAAAAEPAKAARGIGEQMLAIVPVNVFQALAGGETLPVIVFAMALGTGVLLAGEAARPVAAMADAAGQAILRAVRLFMELAPLGALALVANAIGNHGLAVFANLSLLAIGLAAGVLFQILVVQGLVVRLLGRMGAGRFFRDILEAVLVAFSTTSSAATLPVSLRVAQERLGLSGPLVSAVIPLGASIARDGTGVYVGLLCMFSAQAFGVELSAIDYLVLVLGSVLLSLGAAGVPSASLFMLSGVLSLIGIGEAQTAAVVAFILPFDRLLDMIRTVPNVTANLAVATAVARNEAVAGSKESSNEA